MEQEIENLKKSGSSSDLKLPQLSSFFKIDFEEEKEAQFKSSQPEDPCEDKEILEVTTKSEEGVVESQRINYLKKQFRNIIENVIPLENQLMLVLFEHIPISKLIRMKNSSRYKFMDRKSTGIPLLDDFVETQVSDDLINFVESHGKNFLKILQEMRRLVKKLVYVRNKIFETLTSLYDLDKESKIVTYFSLNKKDYQEVSNHCIKMKESGVFSDKTLWHINERDPDKPYCSDIELTY